MLGIGNTKYWRLVKAGVIETVQLGARTMATYASVEALARLPQADPALPAI